MGLLKKLFRSKNDKVPSLAQLAELMKPDNIDPRSDYALTSNLKPHRCLGRGEGGECA
jgi:hypothetical protein